MRIASSIISVALLVSLSGCGGRVPNFVPSGDDQLFVDEVHMAIRCEIIAAVHEANQQALEISSYRSSTVDFFETWGIRYTLTLQVAENSSANASVSGTSNVAPSPGSTVATVTTGIGTSAKATQTTTDQSFNTVKLYSREKLCADELNNRIVPRGRDLGIGEWLRQRLALVDRGIIGSLTEAESFNYKTQFEVSRTASLSPLWTFLLRDITSASIPLAAGRSTVHSVSVTIGPTTPDRTKLAETASTVHDASIFGIFINR